MKYNIDDLLVANDPEAKVLFSMWKILAPAPRCELRPEEKVVLDGWLFELAFGNGMLNIIREEDFQTLLLGFRCLKMLQSSFLRGFVADIQPVLEEFRLWGSPSEMLARRNNLSKDEWNDLELRLDCAEEPYRKGFLLDEY